MAYKYWDLIVVLLQLFSYFPDIVNFLLIAKSQHNTEQ